MNGFRLILCSFFLPLRLIPPWVTSDYLVIVVRGTTKADDTIIYITKLLCFFFVCFSCFVLLGSSVAQW